MNERPEAVAQRLLTWQLRSAAVGRGEVTDDYVALFGTQGWKLYCRLALAEWERLHAGVTPRHIEQRAEQWVEQPAEQYAEQRERCVRLTALIVHAAMQSGDFATLIQVKSRHPENADDYVALARLCRQMGDRAQALKWARRGAAELPASETHQLHGFLAEAHEASEDWDEALAARFAEFQRRPSLQGYQAIAHCAQRAGKWQIWREQALRLLPLANASMNAFVATSRPGNVPAVDVSTQVSILLREGEDDAAWQAAQLASQSTSQPNECRDNLWLEIAARRIKKHPEDALFIYQRLIADYASRKNRYSYELAVQTLRRMGRLLKKMKRPEEFLPYVESLCRKHRYQHAFIKMLRQLMMRHSNRKTSGKT